MSNSETQDIGVMGVFLNGWLKDGKKIHIEIPKGLKKIYGEGAVLLLEGTFIWVKMSSHGLWING